MHSSNFLILSFKVVMSMYESNDSMHKMIMLLCLVSVLSSSLLLDFVAGGMNNVSKYPIACR